MQSCSSYIGSSHLLIFIVVYVSLSVLGCCASYICQCLSSFIHVSSSKGWVYYQDSNLLDVWFVVSMSVCSLNLVFNGLACVVFVVSYFDLIVLVFFVLLHSFLYDSWFCLLVFMLLVCVRNSLVHCCLSSVFGRCSCLVCSMLFVVLLLLFFLLICVMILCLLWTFSLTCLTYYSLFFVSVVLLLVWCYPCLTCLAYYFPLSKCRCSFFLCVRVSWLCSSF